MGELAYPIDHPAHPDNAGKKYAEPRTPFNSDYPADHPARGGQGQAVATLAGSNEPRDGHKHLHGLAGATLAEREKSFKALPREKQIARLAWNRNGIPVMPEEKPPAKPEEGA